MEVAKEKYDHFPGENGKGGVTICQLYDADGLPIVTGTAVCSKLDTYSKKRGRVIAKGRALKVLRTGKVILTHSSGKVHCSGFFGKVDK